MTAKPEVGLISALLYRKRALMSNISKYRVADFDINFIKSKSNQIMFISGNIWPIQTSRKTVNIKKTDRQT